ncbi:Peptidase U49 [Caloranaerobacter azorensis DSM 13643]|uniref:Peptidase U49 n=1 Tax=Caloranaerobacter azorensis DSM 13643 TaxID=1121264 RepID=A0A1M5WP32_9FIRM|nr:hypothetical protein [Caloranaerobacter azorensis]SHH88753.1 Peptidase U49 [Caloranaerobacter azorensis DSM 13643]
MSNNNIRYFDNPYEYLKWEYSRQKNKKLDLKNLNIDILFSLIKNEYDDIEFYEKDKDLFKKLKEIAINLDIPITEQDSSGYFILKRHSENIIKIGDKNNIAIPNDIVLGTLPLNYLDAFTCVFPQGQRLIALSEGLLLFLYSMGRVVSSFFSKINDDINRYKSYVTFDFNSDSINKNLKMNKKGHEHFLETLIVYFAYENLSFSKIYYKEDANINLSAVLWDTAELFIVAHEYSHIILGHLPEEKDFIRRFLDDDSMLYQIVRNWSEEFSADSLAFQLTMANNQNTGYGLFGCYLGIEFLFACLDIIEKVYNIEFTETHPSAQMRIENLRRYFKNTLPETSQNILKGSRIIQEIITTLWDSNKDNFNYTINHIFKNINFKKD